MKEPNKASPYLFPGLPAAKDRYTPERIITLVCEYYSLPIARVMSKSRQHKLVAARRVSWVLMRHYIPDMSVSDIGQVFRLNHSSVVYGLQALANDLEHNEQLDADVEAIKHRVKYW